jgi:hypothetical protein
MCAPSVFRGEHQHVVREEKPDAGLGKVGEFDLLGIDRVAVAVLARERARQSFTVRFHA